MRIIHFSIIALGLCFILQSCSKVNQEPETTGPDPLWPEVIMLWPGEDSVITINDFPKIVKVSTEDVEVVQAIIEDGAIKLSASIPGSTILHITGEGGQAIIREVRSLNLTYVWRSYAENGAYKNSVIVEANDPAFASTLKDQLLLELNRPYAIDFGPGVPEDGLGSFRHTIPGNPTVVTTGTFDFGDLSLELNFSDSKKTYKVIPFKNRELLGLEEDLTEHYKTLHPDKGIQKVIITQYINRYLPPG